MVARTGIRRYVLVPQTEAAAPDDPAVRRYRLARLGGSPRGALGDDRHERLERAAGMSPYRLPASATRDVGAPMWRTLDGRTGADQSEADRPHSNGERRMRSGPDDSSGRSSSATPSKRGATPGSSDDARPVRHSAGSSGVDGSAGGRFRSSDATGGPQAPVETGNEAMIEVGANLDRERVGNADPESPSPPARAASPRFSR